MAMVTDDNAIYHFGSQFATQLAQGLADNWSQVHEEIIRLGIYSLNKHIVYENEIREAV